MYNRQLVRKLISIFLALVVFFLIPGLASWAEQESFEPYALGLIPSPEGDYPHLTLAGRSEPLPEWVDLSEGMPPVGNQGRQPSCVGWAVAYYVRSYQEGIENGYMPMRRSQFFSPAYIYNQRSTNTGMSLIEALRIAVSQGVATWETMPYVVGDASTLPSSQARAEAAMYRAERYVSLMSRTGSIDLDLLKAQLASGNPFIMAIPVYSEFYKASRSNAVVHIPGSNSIYYGGHAVTVVGYNDAAETIKVVNSWGGAWGENGYGYLTYDFVRLKAWEAWALIDQDTTPPPLPNWVEELGGAQSGISQSSVDRPAFVWEESTDPSAVYAVYWGPSPEGNRAVLTTKEARFEPGTVEEGQSYYLRLQAQDGAGNATAWETFFEFRYEKPPEGRRHAVPIQPELLRSALRR